MRPHLSSGHCWHLLLVLVLLPSAARGQYLSRAYYPLWMEEYENYAVSGYQDALRPVVRGSGTSFGSFSVGVSSVPGYYLEQQRNAYDPFGNYLVDGLDVFRLEEYQTLAPDNGSSLYKSDVYHELFQNLVVATDSYRGWSSRFLIGDAIRTKFTPLTLDMARLNGIRWDVASRKSGFSLVASRVSDPVPEIDGLAAPRVQPFASYLIAGRLESSLGDVLTFGTSYTALLRMDSRVRNGSSPRGVVPSSLAGPKFVFVVMSDDSPEDDSGAMVYGLEMYVNGQRSQIAPDVRRVTNLLSSKAFITGQDKLPLPMDAVSYLRQGGSWPSTLTGYYDVLNADPTAGNVGVIASASPVDLTRERPVAVEGTDLLIFLYNGIPPDAKSVEFRALVANDYNIDVATGLGRVEAATLVWDDWHNVSRAAGNVRDGSNLGWVKFSYDFPTGVSVFGFDASARILGAAVNAEVTRNVDYYRFPAMDGKRRQGGRFAYYANLTRPFGRHQAGMEVFGIPADYRTSLPVWSQAANHPVRFDLVDDNDDRDEWADYEDKNGVYPGLDVDDDGVIDTNVNDNNVPDYLEPFLMYYLDPDDFVYGNDFNHNGVVDSRENNNTPDYPYDLDSRGYHVFLDLQPMPDLRYTVAYYDERQMTTGGRNRTAYGELEYRWRSGERGSVKLANRTERVWDDIRNDLAVSSRDTLGGSRAGTLVFDRFSGLEGMGYSTDATDTRGGVLDPLALRNSVLNTAFAQVRMSLAKNLKSMTSLKMVANFRRKEASQDGVTQGASTERIWAFVHRADYALEHGNFDFAPMYKFRLVRQERPSSGRDPFYYAYHFAPMARLDYHFTSETTLRFGLQGFPGVPGLEERYRERSSPYEQFDAETQLLLLQNKGNYSGFDLFLNMGYRRTQRDFRTRSTSQSVVEGEYFVQVFME